MPLLLFLGLFLVIIGIAALLVSVIVKIIRWLDTNRELTQEDVSNPQKKEEVNE
jgi:hypothetical protein